MGNPRGRGDSGFTLVELMVVLAVVALLLLFAAPSFREMMEAQRVRGVSDQFLTDVQFARSEAVARQETVAVTFKPPAATMTCYIVHTCGSLPFNSCRCDCSAAAGSRCPAASLLQPDPPREIRTVQLDTDSGVSLVPVLLSGNPVPASPNPTHITFNPATGGLTSYYATGFIVLPKPPGGAFWAKTSSTRAGSSIAIRDVVNTTGRPHACRPPSSTLNGLASC